MFKADRYKDIAPGEIYLFEGYALVMRKDGIIQLEFEAGFSGDVEDARNMIKTMRLLKKTPKCYMLVIYADDNTFTKETREYIASDEVSALVAADALVTKGLALRIIGNGYLKINKPARPTRLFKTPEDGIVWLKTFME